MIKIVHKFYSFQYNGDPTVVDSEGRNAFYYAHCSYHFDCANFLARNGCPRQSVPVPTINHFPALHQQQQPQPPPPQHHQQVKSPQSSSTAASMTPKHHSAAAAAYQQQQQQQQQVLGYRGGSTGVVSATPGMPPPTPQGVMAGGFAPGEFVCCVSILSHLCEWFSLIILELATMHTVTCDDNVSFLTLVHFSHCLTRNEEVLCYFAENSFFSIRLFFFIKDECRNISASL